MKFFSREWARGQLSEEATERIREAYAKHVNQITDSLPPSIARLLDLYLHDAIIDLVQVSQERYELRLSLVCGDLQRGYSDVILLYEGVDWSQLSLDSLRQVAQDPETELLHDEVDIVGSGRFAHRLLFWPCGEIEIVFEALDLKKLSRPLGSGRSPSPRPARFQEQ